MEYEEVLACLFEAKPIKEDDHRLKAVKKVSEALGSPEKSFAAIHIAGTNGKGSVTTKIAKVLELCGLKAGLYTSPHVFSYQERISINGELISKEEVVEGALNLFSQMDALDTPLSFFEMTTLLAFQYFRKMKVDVAVIETGIGGRCDATNIITPLVSVITSISKDHVPRLGTTLEEIAKEKAGIIKPNIPVVVGHKAVYKSITDRAEELSAPLLLSQERPGFYDRDNSEIAKNALSLLSAYYPISQEAIDKGLRVRPPCRFEELGNTIFDVAHNEDGFSRLLEALRSEHPKKSFRMCLGCSKDKDVVSCLKLASQHASHLYLVQANGERAMPTGELAKLLEKLGYLSYSQEESIKEGVQKAQQDCLRSGELLVIAGSFYIMAEAKAALWAKEVCSVA